MKSTMTLMLGKQEYKQLKTNNPKGNNVMAYIGKTTSNRKLPESAMLLCS